jgi:hypothetical protein
MSITIYKIENLFSTHGLNKRAKKRVFVVCIMKEMIFVVVAYHPMVTMAMMMKH